ncbi:TetR/AcrR family transcriptional regulator [Actinophytocola sp.]|uniref:TetR/AcrR family transcriptional regulator n=1 Tax=Actinophytocola sp. TaxID=1872138 RepID=UPI003D6BC982
MPTSAERGREVRARLLEAAAALIGERGWSAVSTRTLAERAGVGPGLVHYHFASLHALLTEAAVDTMREVTAAVRPLLAAAGTPADAVRLLMASLDEYTGRDPASRMFVETYLAATRDRALREAVASVLDDLRAEFTTWLRAQEVADPEGTAVVLAAAVDGLLLHRALDAGITADAVTPVLTRLVRDDSAAG